MCVILGLVKKMSGTCDKLIKKSKSKTHFAPHFFTLRTGDISLDYVYLYNGAREGCSHKCSITLRTDIFSEPGL